MTDQTVTIAHPDDFAVDRFADAMKKKMAASRAKGRSGWDDPSQCPAESLQAMLLDHLGKGDPVDIGNFAMMLWNRSEKIAAPDFEQRAKVVWDDALTEAWAAVSDLQDNLDAFTHCRSEGIAWDALGGALNVIEELRTSPSKEIR